jgi:hypothetical protein
MTTDDVEALVEAVTPGARVTPLLGGWLFEVGGCSVRLGASTARQSDVEYARRVLAATHAKEA